MIIITVPGSAGVIFSSNIFVRVNVFQRGSFMHFRILFSTRATPIISYSGSPLVWWLSGRETKVAAMNPQNLVNCVLF